MKCIVQLLNNRQRVAVMTDDGYTIFDIEDGEVAIGDILEGALDSHGSQTLRNNTSGKNLLVYIEAIQSPRSAAINLLRAG